MGNLITYQEQTIGEITKGRWRLMRGLLPVLIDYLNDVMEHRSNWTVLANVSLHADGTTSPPSPPPDTAPPPGGPLAFDRIFGDDAEAIDEIEILDPSELERLFAWFAFVAERDGALDMGMPVMEALYSRVAAIDDYLPKLEADPEDSDPTEATNDDSH